MSDSINARMKAKLHRMARSPSSKTPGRFPRSPTSGGMPSFNKKGGSQGRNAEADESSLDDGIVEDPTATTNETKPGSKRNRKGERAERKGASEEDNKPAAGVIPSITLADMGGLAKELPIINELIELPIRAPHLFARLGADPPCGVLLHGPPGCGKTKLAHAIAGSLQVPLFFISAPEVVSGISGDSEAKLRTLFMDAISVAPSIVFIDEIDTIATSRDSSGHTPMSQRIVGQLLTCMDQVGHAWRDSNKVVCVMGATNRPEAIDSALRRAGRFDREIGLGIPSLDERISILKCITKKLHMSSDVDFFEIANMTPGFVGADLHLLIKEASIVAIRRKHKELEAAGTLEDPSAEALENFCVEASELKAATKRVQPSAMREGFTTIPNVSWSDVGALEEVRADLMTCILQPIRAPKLHKRFGLDNPTGVLLYGPPGCGKTLVAKAIANESGANFISIKGPELLNKFVGESERSVRMVFARGRASAPCVLFFDELDALAPRRGSDRANPSSERVVNQLLTEMDGVESRENVFVIGATNRPDMIDPAMLRPGRLDKLMYVPLPTEPQRASILKTIGRKYPLDDNVDLVRVAHDARLTGFSGADLASLMREASMTALKTVYNSKSREELDEMERDGDLLNVDSLVANTLSLPTITKENFEEAMNRIKPSVTHTDRLSYEELHRNLTSQ